MAVVAVGDMDPAALEALIKKEFAPLAKPTTPAPARDYPMPLKSEVLVKMATDPEATQSSVSDRAEAATRIAGQGQRLSAQPGRTRSPTR